MVPSALAAAYYAWVIIAMGIRTTGEISVYFYVDESGHTGGNLFDVVQPIFYYGLLSSPFNLDVVARQEFEMVRKILQVRTVHSKEIGAEQLELIADVIFSMQVKYELRFDIARMVKNDHTVITFFDQVFDSGMNDATPWEYYNTPAKYPLLFEMAKLFDDELAKLAWLARVDSDDTSSAFKLVELCKLLLKRVHLIRHERPRQVIRQSLTWAIQNAGRISYNVADLEGVKDISPNMIVFQAVLTQISEQLAGGKTAETIVVDRQHEFNDLQQRLYALFYQIKDAEQLDRADMPTLKLENLPNLPLTVSASEQSLGLQLVDVFLWAARRVTEGRPIGPKLSGLLNKTEENNGIFEISLNALKLEWAPYFAGLSRDR